MQVSASEYSFIRPLAPAMRGFHIAPGRDTLTGRIALEGRMVHIPDIVAYPEYKQTELTRLGGWRTILGVPLMREGVPIAELTLTPSDVRPFTEKQIELVATFADQAVIAIENTRLFQILEWIEQHPLPPGTDSTAARAALERRTVHIPDVHADPDYTVGAKAIESFHTVLSVPILKADTLLGVITIFRPEVRPTDRSPWSRPLPTKQQSRSRMFDYWTNCVSAPMILADRSGSCARSVKCRRR